MKVQFLQSRHPDKNQYAFLYPVKANRYLLKLKGIDVTFSKTIDDTIYDCDVLIVTSKFGRENNWWKEGKREHRIAFFENARQKVRRVLWADLGDSTGATHFETLDYVDRYLKAAVLKDKMQYLKKMYGNRIFTDFYHRNNGVKDGDAGAPHLNHIPEPEQLDKIFVSWNQAYANYSSWGYYVDTLCRYVHRVPPFRPLSFTHPGTKRQIDLSCRVSSNYGRNTVAFQRKSILKELKDLVPPEKVSRRIFYKELQNSRMILSPFGWGEVCFRDFETFIAGACLLKPDCSHMNTWPNLYREYDTYIPFKWDLSDLRNLINEYGEKPAELKSMAERGQVLYKNYLISAEGKREFCDRFIRLVNF